MALKEGEQYRWSNPDCGCKITVTKSAAADDVGDHAPRCCCGHSMEKTA